MLPSDEMRDEARDQTGDQARDQAIREAITRFAGRYWVCLPPESRRRYWPKLTVEARQRLQQAYDRAGLDPFGFSRPRGVEPCPTCPAW